MWRASRLAKEARRLARKLPELAGRLVALAEEYETTFGWYYTLRISEMTREKLTRDRLECVGAELLAALDLLLRGTPLLIAPFRMQPYYVLLKSNGERVRQVRLTNIRGQDSGLVALPARDFTATRDWRT